MQAILVLAGIALATLVALASTLADSNSVSRTVSRQADSALAVSEVSRKVLEGLQVAQGEYLPMVEWPADETGLLDCGPLVCQPVAAPAQRAAAGLFVCPVASNRLGMGLLAPGEKEGAFYKAAPEDSLRMSRPVAFVLGTNRIQLEPGSMQETTAAGAACDQLGAATLSPTPLELGPEMAQAMQALGIQTWRVLRVSDALQVKGSRHVKAPVADMAELAALPEPQLGDIRLVRATEQLLRYGEGGWESALRAPTPLWTENGWWANSGRSVRDNVFVPVPETLLPDGTIVPSFRVAAYEMRHVFRRIDTTGNGRWEHLSDGLSTNAGHLAAPEPPILTGYTWAQAKTACEDMGAKLPSLPQWLALAHRATRHAANWDSGQPGEGEMAAGVSAPGLVSGPIVASQDFGARHFGLATTAPSAIRALRVAGGYAGDPSTVCTGCGLDGTNARAPASVWDLAGNAAEWIDWTPEVSMLPQGDPASPFCAWGQPCGEQATDELFSANARPPLAGVPGGWIKSTGVGSLAVNNSPGVDGCTGACTTTVAVAMGGSAESGAGGVFTVDTRWGRGYSSPFIGFRCVRQPWCTVSGSCAP